MLHIFPRLAQKQGYRTVRCLTSYLVIGCWPELTSVLSTCRGIAGWCPTTWSSLWVNGTDSTPPAPVFTGEKRNETTTTEGGTNELTRSDPVQIWWAKINGWAVELPTKRLSNFLASVMWIQLSFSMTLMCFTSSLNLQKVNTTETEKEKEAAKKNLRSVLQLKREQPPIWILNQTHFVCAKVVAEVPHVSQLMSSAVVDVKWFFF